MNHPYLIRMRNNAKATKDSVRAVSIALRKFGAVGWAEDLSQVVGILAQLEADLYYKSRRRKP